ncbi:MAG: type 1 glutamine amidotransferase [Nitrospirota bacterium]|nr:type 1 glutamine amidotransferase [Nitrospirota bacterium]
MSDGMKRAICLQHVAFEGPGAFADLLVGKDFIVSNHLVPKVGLPPDAGDVLLVMGGPMSVNDPEHWIEAETTFIRDAVESGTPVLGVCLGAQLLAKALGAQVAPGPGVEIGMTPINLTDQGREDPVFGTLPDPLEVFQWHGEAFDLPDGAVPLASSYLFPLQAFRFGSNAYGVLFHLEMQRDGIEALCQECPGDVTKAGQDPSSLLRHAEPHLPRLHSVAERLIAHLTEPTR